MYTKVLNSLGKLSCFQRRACHGVVPHNGAISSTTTYLLWLLHTQAKSKQSQACIVLTWGILGNSKKGSLHVSAWNKISAALYTIGKLSLSTVSKCYATLSCLARMSPLKHNCYLRTKVCTLRLSFLAVFH